MDGATIRTARPGSTASGAAPVIAPLATHVPGRGITIRQGSGMGGNPDENIRTGQHRVSDRDADNPGSRGKDGRKRQIPGTARVG